MRSKLGGAAAAATMVGSYPMMEEPEPAARKVGDYAMPEEPPPPPPAAAGSAQTCAAAPPPPPPPPAPSRSWNWLWWLLGLLACWACWLVVSVLPAGGCPRRRPHGDPSSGHADTSTDGGSAHGYGRRHANYGSAYRNACGGCRADDADGGSDCEHPGNRCCRVDRYRRPDQRVPARSPAQRQVRLLP